MYYVCNFHLFNCYGLYSYHGPQKNHKSLIQLFVLKTGNGQRQFLSIKEMRHQDSSIRYKWLMNAKVVLM